MDPRRLPARVDLPRGDGSPRQDLPRRDGSPRDRSASVVVIGTFDGVHRGHRHLIATALDHASRDGLACVVLTFDRHPSATVRPGTEPPLLTDVEQKLDLLAATGVDEVRVLAFDEQRASESPEDFVNEVLVGHLKARRVVVGASFRFGHRARGDVQLLEEMGAGLGFRAEGVPLLVDERSQTAVSSTSIRALIAAGDLVAAAHLLGREHEVKAVLRAGISAGAAVAVHVPGEILLPPPGCYRVLAGPVDGLLTPAIGMVGRSGQAEGEPVAARPVERLDQAEPSGQAGTGARAWRRPAQLVSLEPTPTGGWVGRLVAGEVLAVRFLREQARGLR